ncbi:MAG TPA: UvrD-helicase domain-containing protein [Candidatus Aphodovivens avistercoris]|nr:UvrD-helicase domain-containing protein [Candidatus Aphodovivens avistercoris]
MMGVRFTDEQRACVEQLAGPVDISAGAGSGKTFTLTQRIAAALADPESGVGDIDQICAITFTRKAAAELKGRVRSTLRAQGRLDQAMKVDGAWISTIHGMCARILRAEALQLGIDPGFRVLEGKERDDLLAQALSTVLGRPSDIVDGAVRGALLREFPVRSVRDEASVAAMAEELASAAAGMPEGFDGFIRGPKAPAPSALARQLLSAYRDVEPFYRDCKPSKTRDAALADLERACEALEAFLAAGDQDLDALLGVLERCPLLRKITTKDEARKEAFDAYQAAHSRVAQNAALARGGALLDELLDLARRVDAEFARLKRAAAALDNDDLARLALRALDDPAVGPRYADRFRLVMVDEFQDTDALQIAIVRRLAGPGLRYLCTVGDAQQSIYRFRGADVNGYRAFRAQLASPEVAAAGGTASLLRLTRNFRSHGDVLAFVRKVCAQPAVFGDDFLDLSAAYDGADYRSADPRVAVSVTLLPAGRPKAGEAARARALTAEAVASHFAQLRAAGHEASEMVVLLGGMTHAQDYAAALRRAGFECIVAGGSTFYTFPEVSVMRSLASAVANPEDTAALFEVLTSDMFRLSADDLLRLSTGWDEAWDIPKNRRLDRGLAALRREEDLSPALRQAVEVLGCALDAVRGEGLSRALAGALANSGWLARLQRRGAEGAAAIANILKALRVVEGLEDGGATGPSSAAQRFRALFASGAKDKPGVLNAGTSQAVRIMTIHASKGLEFPLVAIAELSDGTVRARPLAREGRAGRTCTALMPGAATLPAGSTLAKAAAKAPVHGSADAPLSWDDALAAPDPAAFLGALRDISAHEEAAEGQRLFYVAATRAKEAVAVFLTVRAKKDDPSCKGAADDIRSALFGQESFPLDSCQVDYGGSQPASYRCIRVEDAAGEGADAPLPADAQAPDRVADVPDTAARAAAPAEMLAPEVRPYVPLPCVAPPAAGTGLFSYSSLAAALPHGADGEGEGDAVPAAASTEPQPADPVSAPAYPQPAAPQPVADPDAPAPRAAKDADAATDFGSAFHRLAQLAALRGDEAARAHLDAACRAFGVADRDRLSAALERWLGSAAHARAQGFARREPELPFTLPVADGVLEGEIDLLCYDEPGGEALIVDYKTGGSPDEDAVRLAGKHRLQGQCYALAALSAGFSSVEAVFVRVERDDPAGADTLQQVRYAYTAADKPALEAAVAACRAAAQGEIHTSTTTGRP